VRPWCNVSEANSEELGERFFYYLCGAKSTYMKKLATLLFCLLLAGGAYAQLKKSRIGNNSNQHITLGVGASYPVFDCSGAIGGAANLSYTYYFMPRLGLRGEAHYAYLRYAPIGLPQPAQGSTTDGLHAGDISAQVVFNYFIDRGARRENNGASFVPERAYLFGGVGCFLYDAHPTGRDVGIHASFPIGTGVAWSIGSDWAIGLDATWRFTLTDDMDAVMPAEFMPDCYATLCLSVTYKIPKQRIGSKENRIRTQRNKACDPRKGCDFTFF
jgi:hypothetical protein